MRETGTVSAESSAHPVPDAVAPPPRHPRFPLVDGLRAVAVIAVVLVHAGDSGFEPIERLLAHMSVGVAVFFVISGFLLYRPFVAHRGGGAPAPAVAAYAKRRFLRIYPAYWLALTGVALIPGWGGVFDQSAASYYLLFHTLPFTPGCDGGLACGLPQTWSLVVELSFYIALPFLALAANRLARGRPARVWLPAELGALGALAVGSVLLHFVFLEPTAKSYVAGTLIGYFFWFALGMGLALVSVALESRGRSGRLPGRLSRNATWTWAAALAIYIGLCAWLPTSPFVLSNGEELVNHLAFGVIALLLLAPAVLGTPGPAAPHRFLAHPAVAWLGLISYGIFLWHLPIALQLYDRGVEFPLTVVATLALSIPLAAASYYLVERPILRLKYRSFRLGGQGGGSSPPDAVPGGYSQP